MKKIILLTIALCNPAYADNSAIGLQLPNSGTSYGEDSIRAGDIDCKNAIGGSTQLEFGVTGVIDNYSSPFNSSSVDATKNVGVYARIVIPLDGPKERINCNSLYELELRKKRLEVLRLQEELDQIRQLNATGSISNFEN